MKRLRKAFVTALALVTAGLSALGCGTKPSTAAITVYMPDGAPALAFAKLMNDENKLGRDDVKYTVVTANDIGGYVGKGDADVALMPITAASKVCAGNYKAVSVITHGNIFLIGKGDADELGDLKGKKIGVIQLAAVPGLTFKALLSKAGVDFVESDTAEENKVALVNISDPSTVPASLKTDAFDYVVAPQPQVANVCKAVAGVSVKIDLNALYSASGFPQAVLVAKNELCEDSAFINALTDALKSSAAWINEKSEDGKAVNAASAVAAVNAHFADGGQSTLDANKLSPEAIVGSNIRVTSARDEKELIKSYINDVLAVNAAAAKAVEDSFFL